MKNLSSICILALVLIACKDEPNQNKESITISQEPEFENYKEYFLEELCKTSPGWASYLGLHEYDGIVIIPDEENKKVQSESYQDLLDSLNNFDVSLLSNSLKTDYYLIKNHLESNLWYSAEFKSDEWNPANYNLAGSVARLLNSDFYSINDKLIKVENILDKSKAFYNQAQSNIKNPSLPHTKLAITQIEGGISVFQNKLRDSIQGSTLSQEEKNGMLVKVDSTTKNIKDYLDFLVDIEKEYNNNKDALDKSKSFRIGKDNFLKKFEYDITSNSSAEEIYQKALKRKGELHQKMISISDSLWDKYMNADKPEDQLKMVKLLIEEISKSHTSRDECIPTIKKQLPELVAFVNEKDLLTQNPEKPLVVRETPMYMRGGGAGASVSAPGPYDKNANTYYNVTPLDNYTDEEAESYLREYNDYVLQVLNIHEAIPGHYTQLVYSNESPSLIKSILGNGAMIEGWAVYTELMMLEEGYKNSPEMWLMYSKWHLRVVCNTILDYSVHVLNMSEEEAKDLLINQAFQEQAEANGKWVRARLTSVQLCSYFTGFSEIYDLRSEIKSIQGSDFNLKSFHEEFLSYGSAPVKYIREMMLSSLNKNQESQ